MILVVRPTEINSAYLRQIINLIISGGQVSPEKLQERLLRADLVAFKLVDEKVICTATLKNPFASYRKKVFNLAKADSQQKYDKELGYIATHSNFENHGHCQDLLKEFYKYVYKNDIYATTRKPSMIHILLKFDFSLQGVTYNKDLVLLTHAGMQNHQ